MWKTSTEALFHLFVGFVRQSVQNTIGFYWDCNQLKTHSVKTHLYRYARATKGGHGSIDGTEVGNKLFANF